ncbi:MAG: PEP-CTERM sorting domain-containing protein [Methylomicrobium sp.]|nr:PEP-CTERM sorting domain-containing protein [Methylomicrobium sp.]
MITKKITGVLSASTLLLGLVFSSSASAAFETCTANILDNVTPNIDCTILSPLNGKENDTLNPTLFVNDKGFFNITNWLYDGKYETGSNSGTYTANLLGIGIFNFTGDDESGTFTKATDAILSDVMLIFKDGADTNLVGYLIDMTKTIGGAYSSPFENPPFNVQNTKEISHISVYYRRGNGGTGTGSVPEPGMIALLGTGLLGFGLTHLRKRKKA